MIHKSLDDAGLREFLSAQDAPCPSCGYNLRGLASDACPECGCAIKLTLSHRDSFRARRAIFALLFAVLLTAGAAQGWRAGRSIHVTLTQPRQTLVVVQTPTSVTISPAAPTGGGGGGVGFAGSMTVTGGVTINTGSANTAAGSSMILTGAAPAVATRTWRDLSPKQWASSGISGVLILVSTIGLTLLLVRVGGASRSKIIVWMAWLGGSTLISQSVWQLFAEM